MRKRQEDKGEKILEKNPKPLKFALQKSNLGCVCARAVKYFKARRIKARKVLFTVRDERPALRLPGAGAGAGLDWRSRKKKPKLLLKASLGVACLGFCCFFSPCSRAFFLATRLLLRTQGFRANLAVSSLQENEHGEARAFDAACFTAGLFLSLQFQEPSWLMNSP